MLYTSISAIGASEKARTASEEAVGGRKTEDWRKEATAAGAGFVGYGMGALKDQI